MNKYIIFLIVIISVLSCRTPKTVYKNVEVHDTVRIKEVLTVIQPRLTNLVVDEPCDSLGRLKPIFYEVVTPSKTLSIKNVDNKLVVVEEDKETVVTKDKEVEKVSTSVTDEVKVITRVPKWAWYSLMGNIVLLFWTFRKFFGMIG